MSTLAIETYSRSEHSRAHLSHCVFLPKSWGACLSAGQHHLPIAGSHTLSYSLSIFVIGTGSSLYTIVNVFTYVFWTLCILRELLVCQSGWPVQGCRIESRYAATWTPNPPYSPPPALSEGGHGCLTSLSIAVRRAFDPASISSALIKPPRSDQRTVVSRGTRWRELSNLCRESPCADPSPRRYRHYGQSRKP
jgi:hypothetical protein